MVLVLTNMLNERIYNFINNLTGKKFFNYLINFGYDGSQNIYLSKGDSLIFTATLGKTPEFEDWTSVERISLYFKIKLNEIIERKNN